jgi:hypothetical protein
MTSRSLAGLSGGLALLTVVVAAPLSAHHSFAAEYDATKGITVTGEVERVEWTNPHARVVVNGKDETGKTARWDFELGPPTPLMRNGWTRNSLKPGTTITVTGFRSKDEPTVANARTVKLADGRELFAGSSFESQGGKTPGTP